MTPKMNNGHFSIRKLIIFAAIAIFIMTTIGCSNKNSSTSAASDETPSQATLAPIDTSSVTSSPSQTTSEAAPTKDNDLTKQLLSEKEVMSGQVYFQGNDYVIATIVIKKGTDNQTSQVLAQKYADLLKAKYKDKKVNVQAVNNGKNIANISIN
jgi:hypothetical protein